MNLLQSQQVSLKSYHTHIVIGYVQISDQPINCLDWCPDKPGLMVASSFDQRVRIVIVTKMNLL